MRMFGYDHWLNEGISAAIQSLAADDLQGIARLAIACSIPLGARRDSVQHFVCVDNGYNNPLLPHVNQPFQMSSSDLKSAMLFYTLDAPFPLESLNGIERWRMEYERAEGRFSYHFDAVIHERMLREHYRLESLQ